MFQSPFSSSRVFYRSFESRKLATDSINEVDLLSSETQFVKNAQARLTANDSIHGSAMYVRCSSKTICGVDKTFWFLPLLRFKRVRNIFLYDKIFPLLPDRMKLSWYLNYMSQALDCYFTQFLFSFRAQSIHSA